MTTTTLLPSRQTLTGLAFAAALMLTTAVPALAAVEEEYAPGGTPSLTTWYGTADPAALAADRAYIKGMRPHHAGALTMAQAYLADPNASSPALKGLAHGIIVNQTFEIGMLDEVERNLNRPPVVLNLGLVRLTAQPTATDGLAQRQRFLKAPMPGLLTALGPVTARDVQFAKGMTIHHQAALDMARDYHANPHGRNAYLGLMNVDIITDQSQEIAFMRRVISAYPGDAAAVTVDPASIHGMEGMDHGRHGGHGGTPTAQAAPAPAAQAPAPPPSAPQAQPAPPRAPAAQAPRRAPAHRAPPRAGDHAGHDAPAGHHAH
jgi:uncharacterized protein (DUF305 family)